MIHSAPVAPVPSAPARPILRDPNPGLGRALIHVFYDFLWLALILLGSPCWIIASLTRRSFRNFISQRLLGAEQPLPPRPGEKPRVLIHGVSVGEVKVAGALVRALAERRPDLDVVISATTSTGLDLARRLYPDRCIVRFPIDFTPVVRRLLARVQPVCVVLMELEIWPGFSRCCNVAGIPLAIVNGRITAESYARYHRFRDLLPQFNRISLFCAQNQVYADRFAQLSRHPERVLITGNMKADGVCTGASRQRDSELSELVAAKREQTIVAGSTHEPEERMVARAWRGGAPLSRLILVPRHPERAEEIRRSLAQEGFQSERLTELRQRGQRADASRPLIVDTIGELEALYNLASLVFVGGSLIPHGGQNMLEPAAQGRAVIYGPCVDNFSEEAALLEEAGAACRVADEQDLERAFARLSVDAPGRARMAAAGREVVLAQRGATEKTLQALELCCLGAR